MGEPPAFYGGASTILLGGPLGILSWQARARTYPHNVWGGRRGGLHLKMSDLGLHGGPAPPGPPYWETLLHSQVHQVLKMRYTVL